MEATVISEGLKVHGAPNGIVVDSFKRGDVVRIRGEPRKTATETWYRVDLVGGRRSSGWVDSRFLRFPEPPPVQRRSPLEPPMTANPDSCEEVNYYVPSIFSIIAKSLLIGVGIAIILIIVAFVAF